MWPNPVGSAFPAAGPLIILRAAFLLAAITVAGCSAATTATAQPVEQPSQSCTVRQPDPTFTTIETENALTRPHRVVAVADWNGDGLDDLVAFPWVEHSNDPADRHQTAPLAILLAQPDATFSRLLAPGLTVEARDPIVLVEDFNQDGTPDMAVFDAGVYATAESTGYGNPPQLLLSRPDFTHELSSALADAVAAHRHSLGPDLPGEPFTGRHVQVLINQGGMEFEDETVSWMGDQSATHIQVGLAGEPQMVKFDRDECADLVVSGSRHDYPFVYRRVGDSFKLQDRPLTTNNGYAADVNGDGAVDFVSLPGGTDVEVLLNRQ